MGIFASSASAQTGMRTITGQIVDEKGEPLAGAFVTSQDGKSGEMADANGNFSIKVKSSDSQVSVSSLGYVSQTVDISDKNTLKLVLLPDPNNTLNEVVVIGYGEVKRADLTGSVASVQMNDIQNAPALAVDESLQGRVAGVDVMSTTG